MNRILALLIILISSLSFAADKVITLTADQWCPWNCVENAEKPGIAVELAKAIYEPLGYKVKYVTMPWHQAIEAVARGEMDALIAADHTMSEVKNFHFPQTPISSFDDVYLLKKESDFTYKNIQSLNGKIIGIVEDYHFGGEIGKYIDANYKNPKIIFQATEAEGAKQNIDALINNKIDMYIDNKEVVLYTANQLGISDKVKVGGSLQEYPNHYYLAFSPFEKSKVLAKLYDEGIEKLKVNGEYKKIFDKYIPTSN